MRFFLTGTLRVEALLFRHQHTVPLQANTTQRGYLEGQKTKTKGEGAVMVDCFPLGAVQKSLQVEGAGLDDDS